MRYHVSIYEIDNISHSYKFLPELDDYFDKFEDATNYAKFLSRKIPGCNQRGYFLMEGIDAGGTVK